ncbi:MAG: translation initiation factor IF-3 [Phycisphaerae bacterium]
MQRCNEQIRLPSVRLIDENNEQVGVVPTSEALRRAREAGLDLVEVAPTERPPVCRIMDFGKFKYSQNQKKKKQKHHQQKLKEIRLHPDVGEHDRDIKVNRAVKFLEDGDKVQFTMVFHGRERFHKEIGFDIFKLIIEQVGEKGKIERPPRIEGQRMVMVFSPGKPGAKPAVAVLPAKPVAETPT